MPVLLDLLEGEINRSRMIGLIEGAKMLAPKESEILKRAVTFSDEKVYREVYVSEPTTRLGITWEYNPNNEDYDSSRYFYLTVEALRDSKRPNSLRETKISRITLGNQEDYWDSTPASAGEKFEVMLDIVRCRLAADTFRQTYNSDGLDWESPMDTHWALFNRAHWDGSIQLFKDIEEYLVKHP